MSAAIQTDMVLRGRNETKRVFLQVENSMKGLASQMSVFKGFDLGSMLGLAGTTAKVFALSAAFSQIVKTSDRLKGIQASFEAITGSTEAAEIQLEKVRKQAEFLGQDYVQLADLTKQWLASTKGTAIEKQQDEILQGFLSYGAVLNLPEEAMQRVVVALSQMASKSKIMSEELRHQLGEALPGAFNMLAKSMNVSTAELNKMLEDGEVGLENLVLLAKDLQDEYSGKVVENADKVANNLARGKNELVAIGQNIAEATNGYEGFNAAVRAGLQMLEALNRGTKHLADFSINFGQMWKNSMGLEETMNGFAEIYDMSFEDHAKQADYYRSTVGKLEVIDNERITLQRKLAEQLKRNQNMNLDEMVYANNVIDIQAIEERLRELDAQEKKLYEKLDENYQSGVKFQNSALPQPEIKEVRKKSASELKKEQKAREKAMNDLAKLNDEIAKLTMTDEEYREFSLTNRLAELTKQLPFATEEIRKFAEAQKKAWAKEDEKKELDKQKEFLEIQASFYEELAKKTGQYSKSLEFQNKLIDEQVKIWKDAEIPEEYISKMESFLRLETSENPFDGFMLGIQENFAEYGNLAVQMKDIYKNAFSEMADALTQWASGADVSFSDVASSFSKMLLEMTVQYTMSNLAQSLFGNSLFGGSFFGFLGGGSAAGGEIINMSSAGLGSYIPTFHSGGMADSPKALRAVSSDIFANAPRYHGGYNPSFEQPAILRKDERVLSPSETYAYNMGLAKQNYGGGNSIVINQEIIINVAENNADMSLSASDMQRLQQQMKESIQMSVIDVIAKEKRAGGMLR